MIDEGPTPGGLDPRALLRIPLVDLPLLAIPPLPLPRPLTADEAAQLHGYFADVARVIAQVAAEWVPVVHAFVDELVRAGVIPAGPPDGETPIQRAMRERRTRTHGPAVRRRAPRVLTAGGRR